MSLSREQRTSSVRPSFSSRRKRATMLRAWPGATGEQSGLRRSSDSEGSRRNARGRQRCDAVSTGRSRRHHLSVRAESAVVFEGRGLDEVVSDSWGPRRLGITPTPARASDRRSQPCFPPGANQRGGKLQRRGRSSRKDRRLWMQPRAS